MDCSWSRARIVKQRDSSGHELREESTTTGSTCGGIPRRKEASNNMQPIRSLNVDALPEQPVSHDRTTAQFLWQDNSGAASDVPAPARTPSSAVEVPKDAYAMTGVLGDPSKSVEFFGSSSAGSFMRQINSAIDARLGRPQASNTLLGASEGSRHASQMTGTLDGSDDPLAYKLPPRRIADDLLNSYWDLLWAVFPIHDRTVFEEAYKSAWLGTASSIPESILHCMINMTLALGSQFSESINPDQRKESGRVFFNRAQKLFSPQLQDSPSIEGVQCLLLMGLFLQSTKESYQCWMLIGSAIRMAQSLGLHLPSSIRYSPGSQQHRDIEIARRVWYGCVYMDRQVLS